MDNIKIAEELVKVAKELKNDSGKIEEQMSVIIDSWEKHRYAKVKILVYKLKEMIKDKAISNDMKSIVLKMSTLINTIEEVEDLFFNIDKKLKENKNG